MGKHVVGFRKFSENLRKQKIVEAEKEKTETQNKYAEFFKKLLKEYDVSSPAELSDEKKSEFFDKVDKGWREGSGLTAAGQKIMNK